MPRRRDYELEDDPDDLDDDPAEADTDADDGDEESETVRCPYCRAAVYEGAEMCPKCGSYISEEDAPAGRPAWAVVVAVALLLAIIIGWLILGR